MSRPPADKALAPRPTGPGAAPRGEGAATDRARTGGNYHYAETRCDADGSRPLVNCGTAPYSILVEPRRGQRQRIDYTEGGGTPEIFTSRFTPTAQEIVREDTGDLGGCAYTPPLVALELPLVVRHHWSTSVRCDGNGTHARLEETIQVVSTAVRAVEGYGQLRVWTIHTTGRTVIDGVPHLSQSTFTDDTDFSPELLVPIRWVHSQQDFDGDTETSSQRITRALTAP